MLILMKKREAICSFTADIFLRNKTEKEKKERKKKSLAKSYERIQKSKATAEASSAS